MKSQNFKISRDFSSIAFSSMSLLVGGALLLGSHDSVAAVEHVPAAGYHSPSASLFQTLQTKQTPPLMAQTTPGDVVVDTEGEAPPEGDTTQGGNPQPAGDTRFACQTVNGQYTVMYYPESQPAQAYAWATPTALGGGWTSQRRCEAISQRLESYRPDGLLEMQTAIENNHNVVCVTTEARGDCRIVFTVPPGQDAALTRDRVFENLTIADSGQSTQGVSTFTNGRDNNDLTDQVSQILGVDLPSLGSQRPLSRPSRGINLKPFLDPADGGTGTMLRGGTAGRSNPRLNPDRFR